eukprot:gene13754-19658_t
MPLVDGDLETPLTDETPDLYRGEEAEGDGFFEFSTLAGFTRGDFPYCRCGRGLGDLPYKLAYMGTKPGPRNSTATCFRVVPGPNAGCPNKDLNKLSSLCCDALMNNIYRVELEIDVKSAVDSANINGYAYDYRMELGPNTEPFPSGTLKITNLKYNYWNEWEGKQAEISKSAREAEEAAAALAAQEQVQIKAAAELAAAREAAAAAAAEAKVAAAARNKAADEALAILKKQTEAEEKLNKARAEVDAAAEAIRAETEEKVAAAAHNKAADEALAILKKQTEAEEKLNKARAEVDLPRGGETEAKVALQLTTKRLTRRWLT